MKLLMKTLPYVSAVIIFLILSIFFFQPTLDGYDLRQGDIENWRGMSHEINDFREQVGEEPLWTNSMFGGMPAYQISVSYGTNLVKELTRVVRLGLSSGPGTVFVGMLSFFILGLCLRIKPWLAIVGGIAFGFASINILYLGAGHTGKIHALAYMPAVIGGILYTTRRGLFFGGALTALFLGFHLAANHLQMTYYLLFLVVLVGIVEAVRLIVAKKIPHLLKAAGVLLVAAFLAFLPNYGNIVGTYEYSKYTTRGESELTMEEESQSDRIAEEGLDKDYILQYSMAKGEVFSLLIPNVKGGKSGRLGNHPEAMQTIDRNYRENLAQQSSYWGDQLFTGGAFYFGAIIVFLFILGIVLSRDCIKWALLAMTLLAIALAWKQTDGLQGWFLENFPYYTKFRDTKMMLVTVQVAMPMMAMIFLNEFLFDKAFRESIRKKLLITGGAFIGVFIIIVATPTSFFDFMAEREVQQLDDAAIQAQEEGNMQMVNYIDNMQEQLIDARVEIFKSDALRSLFFVIGAAVFLLLVLLKVLDRRIALGVIGILVLADLWGVDRRYLNSDRQGGDFVHYVKPDEKAFPFEANPVDMQILEQEKSRVNDFQKKTSQRVESAEKKYDISRPIQSRVETAAKFAALNANTNYRVLNMRNPFADGRTSYFHKSIGGYHGAKLKRFQELIDFQLQGEIQSISQNANQFGIMGALERVPVINMLNTKYIIAGPESAPIENPFAMGNAWFVQDINWVPNADAEMNALSDFDPETTAIVDERFKDKVSTAGVDSTASIRLESYEPNHLVYRSSASQKQVAVFSEIYYPKGWNAYVDGEKVDYFRANYLLRAMEVPAGDHKIEFKFEPQSYQAGLTISLIGSILVLLYFLAAVFYKIRNANKNPEEMEEYADSE
ncbi:YfhO family protein [Halocola ammonii]